MQTQSNWTLHIVIKFDEIENKCSVMAERLLLLPGFQLLKPDSSPKNAQVTLAGILAKSQTKGRVISQALQHIWQRIRSLRPIKT